MIGPSFQSFSEGLFKVRRSKRYIIDGDTVKKLSERVVVMPLILIFFGLVTHSLAVDLVKKPSDCEPQETQGCNGDPNAEMSSQPWPCRSTCAKPDTRDCVVPYGGVAAGCICKNGYVLSDENGKCIKVEDCPCGDPCAPNGTLVNFLTSCPYEYCPREDRQLYPCDPVVPSPTGCACKANYKRLNSIPDKCVLASDCPFVCPIPRECRPTCANPNPPLCFDAVPASLSLTDPVELSGNIDGCQCQKGYILSDADGKCIKIEECPQNQGCNGDPNAVVKACPWPCPSTCSQPNTVLCYKSCLPVGCQCAPGYLLSESGLCILPKDCKGGDPCGPNGTFSYCSHRCPETYCPKNDDRAQPVCDPIYPCPPGCMCKINHRRLSYEDDRCIVTSECPPVKCTRQNEVWDSCPSDCLAEYCENVNDPPVTCNTLLLNCQPKCVCAKGYFRNSTTELCVPATECANYNNPCKSPCAPTCAEPNPQGCKSPQNCCKDGYILSERNGKCIKIEDCPRQIGCNGDPNAVVKKCPAPCPSTCDHPEPNPCKKMCLAVGCECAPGYLMSADGNCIQASQCPGGDPCGPNGTYVECAFRCPNQYCPQDDSQVQIACKPPRNCPPGCACKLNHKRLSYEDDRCIVSSECPPVECTRPNEVWSPCPIVCPFDNCENVNDPPSVCYTLVLNCQPSCICADGYYRNSSGICVPAKECEGFNPCLSKCSPTCDVPNPRNCGCLSQFKCCKDGYILTERNGTCIKIEDCPKSSCGKNEKYVVDSNECRKTCSNYESYKPGSICKPITGCICQTGYVRTNDDGTGPCIPENECVPLPVCGKNQVPRRSRIVCPPQSCESIYTTYNCENVKPEPGCDCIDGYLRDSKGVCIPNEQCPPPGPVCGENEVATINRTVCPPQTCASLYTLYKCDSNRTPEVGCDCIKGYLRDSNGVCIPSEKCPLQPSICPVSKKCRPTCASPNPPNCPVSQPAENNNDGCQCQEGYILSEAGGKCIRVDECPQNIGCNGDPNAVVRTCPNPCPSTCKQPDTLNCNSECLKVGCECAPGYLKSGPGGKCIPVTQCPGGDPCGPNGTFVQCVFRCPDQFCPRDDGPQPVCLPGPYCRSGCGCKLNHKRLSFKDDRCILATDCPPVNCTRPNEVWSSCPSGCLSESCENVNDPPSVCNTLVLNCQPKCICADGYYRNSSGICIPANKCKGYNPCLSRCTPTCVQPNPPNCGKSSQNKCCKTGYILTQRNGTCVKNGCCPKLQCGKNEIASDRKIVCPPQTCASKYTLYRCKPDLKPVPGCNCIKGYLRDPSGVCIPSEKCPPILPLCGENEIATENRIICPPQTCDSLYIQYNCILDLKREPGCDCIKGYLRNSSGICIPREKCPRLPPPKIICGRNEVLSNNKIVCPPQTCESRYIKYRCIPNIKPKPGCNCIPGYLRDKRGVCIPSKLCPGLPPILPLCGKNEVYSSRKITCPPQTCAGRFALYKCNPLAETKPGCNCILGYLRNDQGVCIPKDQCPPPPLECGPNEVAANEKIDCPPQTCESIYTSYSCEPKLPKPGCNCINGYLRNASGICIPSEKCSMPTSGCKGDPNATLKHCPNPCPATCQNPNPSGVCPRACLKIGCECNPGYILSNGTCVLPKDCPGGVTCPANEQYVRCKVECPNNFCPTNDNRGILICDPAFPCPGGCVCKGGYLRKSNKERYCIEACKCPPVKCTRPNEVWNPSPPNCIRETCEDRNKGPNDPCYLPYLTGGRPQCVCRDGYYRNRSDICIPASECPFLCPISSECRPTCAVPNPKNCPATQPANSNIDGCQCQRGYILSNANGKCIRVEECPENQGCNGDPNAVVKECPSPCPSTCSSPDNSKCKRACESVGCQCAPGYLRSEPDGKCMPVGKCPGGDPCGPNSTFVSCAFRCPNQFCPRDDSRVQIACKPGRNCPSGCGCKLNYKRLSYEDDRCILSTDCPPVNCTRPNEIWSSCPSDCLAEECGNVNDPPSVCNTLVLNCQPKCICAEGYYRNSSDICIPANECEGFNPCLSKCAPTCAEPNPPNCNYPFANTCCKEGYILSERDGVCIRIEDCPRNITCNGDSHAIVKKCPSPNPATCKKPVSERSEEKCKPVGCECAPGYIRSEPGGQCILATKCPGGDPCGPNGTFVQCSFRCPDQFCPKNDSPFQVACMPPLNCPPGCACKSKYKRLSSSDDRCILASDCPPVVKKCTKPNEFWAVCPTPCDVADCKNVNEPPRACIALAINCKPQCICANGYYRNIKGQCVPAEQCENYDPCLSQCVPTCAEPNPPDCDPYSEKQCCPRGWILSERGGRCIKIEDCPKNIACNGDPNAVVKQCPAPCPSTCDRPNAFPCRKACYPVGCECAKGYLRLENNGKCVKPEECPGGYPCSKNEVFVSCKIDSESSFCPKDDNRITEDYSDNSCLSGCICKVNYRRKSYDDRTCIVASDCPPVNCTRPNEEWSSCPSACLQESCEDVGKKPVTCNTLVLNCQPQCICCKGYYRNSTDICVPPNQCPCN